MVRLRFVHKLRTLHVLGVPESTSDSTVYLPCRAPHWLVCQDRRAGVHAWPGSPHGRLPERGDRRGAATGWIAALLYARWTLGVTGFVAVKTGTPLYTKAKEIYRGTKELRRAPYDDYPMKAVKDTKEWVTIPNWEPFGT